MYLTAVLKLHTNPHDEYRIAAALARWHEYFDASLAHARARQPEFLRCLTMWTPKRVAPGILLLKVQDEVVVDAAVYDPRPLPKSGLVVNKKARHALVLACVPQMPTLHSACRMAMIVAVEDQVGSWLGLYAEWVNGKRKTPKPGFPSVAPSTPAQGLLRWHEALRWGHTEEHAADWHSLAAEDEWRAAVSRAAKGSLLPLYFGAAASGAESQAHCGILKRADGRYFALLTLFPLGDKLGGAVTRARNRTQRGAVRSVRGTQDFTPTDRARASLMVPLECDQRIERLYLERGVPKSAHLVRGEDGFYLHVASEVPERPPAENGGNVLALQRGITTLVHAVVLSAQGTLLHECEFSDKGLAALITQIGANRAVKQQKGKLTTGDRRAGLATEEHLHLLVHEIVEVARTWAVQQIVVLADPFARTPQRYLAYKHWSEMFAILSRCCRLAGTAAPVERAIYGSLRTCPHCGHVPEKTSGNKGGTSGTCGECSRERSANQAARLLALDTLRFRGRTKNLPTLGAWISAQAPIR